MALSSANLQGASAVNTRALRRCLFVLIGLVAVEARAREQIRLAEQPALSPDGSLLAFAWRGEIWTVPSSGGVARQLTRHSGADGDPEFSPDGSQIAFVSERNG